VNPEIRFRVPDDVYALAAERAERLLGDSSRAVSNLARGALYRALGLRTDVPDLELPRESPEVSVRVRHRVAEEFRRRQALRGGAPVPAVATTELRFAPGSLPEGLHDHLELDSEGRASVRLELDQLSSARETASLEEVLQALEARQVGRQRLKEWAEQHGSALVRARRQEGFDWEALARLEYARRLPGLEGFSPLGEIEFQPHREPALAEIEQLREARRQVAGTLELVLVGGPKRWTSGALLATVAAPDGQPVLLYKRLGPTPHGNHYSQQLAP